MDKINVICQCGCVVNEHDLEKHLKTSTHERQMVGREQIEGVDPYKHKPRQKT